MLASASADRQSVAIAADGVIAVPVTRADGAPGAPVEPSTSLVPTKPGGADQSVSWAEKSGFGTIFPAHATGASVTGAKPRKGFEVTNPSAREAPTVDFGTPAGGAGAAGPGAPAQPAPAGTPAPGTPPSRP